MKIPLIAGTSGVVITQAAWAHNDFLGHVHTADLLLAVGAFVIIGVFRARLSGGWPHKSTSSPNTQNQQLPE